MFTNSCFLKTSIRSFLVNNHEWLKDRGSVVTFSSEFVKSTWRSLDNHPFLNEFPINVGPYQLKMELKPV